MKPKSNVDCFREADQSSIIQSCQAIEYTLKRWTALNQFVSDGVLEIDLPKCPWKSQLDVHWTSRRWRTRRRAGSCLQVIISPTGVFNTKCSLWHAYQWRAIQVPIELRPNIAATSLNTVHLWSIYIGQAKQLFLSWINMCNKSLAANPYAVTSPC